jgi:hypothetical protein
MKRKVRVRGLRVRVRITTMQTNRPVQGILHMGLLDITPILNLIVAWLSAVAVVA